MVNILAVASKVGKGAVEFLAGGVKRFIAKPSIKTGAGAVVDVASTIFPAGKVAKAGKFVSPVLKGARGLLGKIGLTKSTPITKFLGKTATFGGATLLGEWAFTGRTPTTSLRTLAGFVATKLSPFGALLGFGKGGIQLGTEFVKDVTSTTPITDISGIKPKPEVDFLPPIIDYPDIPSPTTTIIQQPGQPISFGMPSISIGGYGQTGGMDLALLTLLLGGAGGYLMGRKKRKKKKKKKKKKNKKGED